MNKNILKKMALASYTKNTLNVEKVNKVAKSLKREDLKVYLKNLKTIEAKKTVTVSIASEDGLTEIKKYFSKVYPEKRLLITIDPGLITGLRVNDYDNVYELSLKSLLEQTVRDSND